MTVEEIEVMARTLYDLCPTVKPDWSQLGDVTKSVWRDMVLARYNSIAVQQAPHEQVPTQGCLF